MIEFTAAELRALINAAAQGVHNLVPENKATVRETLQRLQEVIDGSA